MAHITLKTRTQAALLSLRLFELALLLLTSIAFLRAER